MTFVVRLKSWTNSCSQNTILHRHLLKIKSPIGPWPYGMRLETGRLTCDNTTVIVTTWLVVVVIYRCQVDWISEHHFIPAWSRHSDVHHTGVIASLRRTSHRRDRPIFRRTSHRRDRMTLSSNIDHITPVWFNHIGVKSYNILLSQLISYQWPVQ